MDKSNCKIIRPSTAKSKEKLNFHKKLHAGTQKFLQIQIIIAGGEKRIY